jgi:hypothetical protein
LGKYSYFLNRRSKWIGINAYLGFWPCPIGIKVPMACLSRQFAHLLSSPTAEKENSQGGLTKNEKAP